MCPPLVAWRLPSVFLILGKSWKTQSASEMLQVAKLEKKKTILHHWPKKNHMIPFYIKQGSENVCSPVFPADNLISFVYNSMFFKKIFLRVSEFEP
jgi:hypothetical protein